MTEIRRVTFFVLLTFATAAYPCWDCAYKTLKIRRTVGELAKTTHGIGMRLQQRPTQRSLDIEKCRRRIPYHSLDQKTAIALRPHLRIGNSVEESVTACVENGGLLWFGLGFYEGEGSDGVGGIGVYDPATKRIEVRRPKWLRDKSIGRLVHDGRFLWFSVLEQFEKSSVNHGLARYDWTTGELQPMRGADAPCGFSIGDLMLDGTTLWMTTGLAISRLDLPSHTWSHFVLKGKDNRFEAADCGPLYRQLLDASFRCTDCEDEEDISSTLARFAPDLTRKYLLDKKPDQMTYEQMKTLGGLIINFQTLRKVIDRTSDRLKLEYAIDAFGETKHDEPAWRDFALQWARESHDVKHLRRFRGDAQVFDYLATVARSSDRNAYKAAQTLPWIDNRRAIPVLLEIVNEFAQPGTIFDDMKYEFALEALERAAHLRIDPTGKRTALAANSDTPEYSDEEDGAFRWNANRDAAEMRRIIGQWNDWTRNQKAKQ